MSTGNNAKHEFPRLLFEHQDAWEDWLARNHGQSPGVWRRIAKKGWKIGSVTYAEALDTALCYGWIDGQKNAEGMDTWLQKFCPRAKKSIWSKINREKAVLLTEAGRMKLAGLAEVTRAKADGRWDAAYDSPRNAIVPDDFEKALDANPKAKVFFATLESRNRYAILFRIQTVKKAETRARRIVEFIAMLERHEKLHRRAWRMNAQVHDVNTADIIARSSSW